MKKIQLLMMVMLMAVSAFSQTIKPNKDCIEDYLPLLQASGYKAYSFDISEFLNDTYEITLKFNEYVDSLGLVDTFGMPVHNRKMLSAFSEEIQQRILKEGRAADPEKGIYSQSDKIIIGFCPTNTDSLQALYLEVKERQVIKWPLKLKGLVNPSNNQLEYHYTSRPFKMDKFEEGKFIPLVLFGSYWIDKEYGSLRFCGDNEMDPDMSTVQMKYSPHYFVIGVEIRKVK